ncbi:MAG: hypothetical protein JRG96_17860 [Deltaproteobacteria bacterium]|nr:hypothetical protein [Deltaproteobacteria bacterium]MBW2421279.1 hypothetical protein [Deltaproteobacteria bacterium]
MEFWSKGLGKKTIAMGLTEGESSVSEDALCLKGVMEAPVSWEYVMLLDEADLIDFFALLQEPRLAAYVHSSPNRWKLYAGFVVGGVQIAWLAIQALLRRSFGGAAQEERLVIQLPPPSVARDKKKKKVLYKRRLDTTNLKAPTHTFRDALRSGPAERLRAEGA